MTADQIGMLLSDLAAILLIARVVAVVFFVVTGLEVDLSHVSLAGIGELAAILLVAFTGKYVGAFITARLLGTDARRAAALATLMNTRGVTELIVLSIGLQLGVLDSESYSYMVVMTVVTTAVAGPLLRLIYPRWLIDRDLADAAAPVMVPSGDGEADGSGDGEAGAELLTAQGA